MLVKDLKKYLESIDENTLVVVPASDHSYRHRIGVHATRALYSGGALYEMANPDDDSEAAPGDKIVKIFVVE